MSDTNPNLHQDNRNTTNRLILYNSINYGNDMKTAEYNESKDNEKNKLTCTITGLHNVYVNSNATVIAAHILPHSLHKNNIPHYRSVLLSIGMKLSDINSTRNFLALVKIIEKCFDEKKLSLRMRQPIIMS